MKDEYFPYIICAFCIEIYFSNFMNAFILIYMYKCRYISMRASVVYVYISTEQQAFYELCVYISKLSKIISRSRKYRVQSETTISLGT